MMSGKPYGARDIHKHAQMSSEIRWRQEGQTAVLQMPFRPD